ncbi:MAG: hypothetical protein R3344_12620, partial [Acidobacteriota bacterium]|nr:hypothetical protein [Acidobacteriota bacterium]
MRVARPRLPGVLVLVFFAGFVAAWTATAGPADALTFEDRVRYQRRLEAVYWDHRIWPDTNPGPKPRLDEVLPDALVRSRVESYLDKSVALERIWSTPLTAERLQAELDRMVRSTKDAEMLRELFAALDNDPHLIAECLVRPVLVDRMVRTRYGRDERLHGALRRQAETALAGRPGELPSPALFGGDHDRTEWRLVSGTPPPAAHHLDRRGDAVFDLDPEEWEGRVGRLAAVYGVGPGTRDVPAATLLDRIPLGRLSPLVEQDDRFAVTMVLSKSADRLRTATVSWMKPSFDSWWAETSRTIEGVGDTVSIPPPAGGYQVVLPVTGVCADDSWTELWYAPEGRTNHTAVWTGAEMIVWGGGNVSGTALLDSGGRYNPATDSWTETSSAAGMPAARQFHTAVWTGTEMIVWGGSDGTDVLDSGARYDPQTDSWASTSTGAGVPVARQLHTAVWTGSEMIVWGGSDGTDVLDSGARYDPQTDSWASTSTG